MCGRYFVELTDDMYRDIKRIINEIERKGINKQYKTGEIFPTNAAPVIAGNDKQIDYRVMDWGFPKWDGKGVIINARSETASTKRMFSKPLLTSRCIIPATGFFEWQKKDPTKPKDKFLFTSDEEPVMYMAGIYNQFQGEDKFAILTRDANVSIADIHDRMPVVVRRDEIEDWLFDDKFIPYLFSRDDIKLNRTLA